MYYITTKLQPSYHQITLEEFLSDRDFSATPITGDETATRTYEVEYITPYMVGKLQLNVPRLISLLEDFNMKYDDLRTKERTTLYRSYKIPKRSGSGYRKIDEPVEELMTALRTLKEILESSFGALYHTSAFAYIKHRCIVDALRKHQSNHSKWFAKYDATNFFGSITLDFTMRMLSMIYPFCEVVKYDHGKEELEKALELGFLNGGLPQGTPLSPTLTNIIMIPVDYKLSNALRDFNGIHYIYTRYADDIDISSKMSFNVNAVQSIIEDTLASFDAPIRLNQEKTRYGSNFGSGANWNLGLMLNQDNQITVGHRNKKRFKASLFCYASDKKAGISWPLDEVRELYGHYNYYRMVEKQTIDEIVKKLSDKTGINILYCIKQDIRQKIA